MQTAYYSRGRCLRPPVAPRSPPGRPPVAPRGQPPSSYGLCPNLARVRLVQHSCLHLIFGQELKSARGGEQMKAKPTKRFRARNELHLGPLRPARYENVARRSGHLEASICIGRGTTEKLTRGAQSERYVTACRIAVESLSNHTL